MKKTEIHCDICGKKTGPRITCYDLASTTTMNSVLVRATPYLRMRNSLFPPGLVSDVEADLCAECYIEALQGIIRMQDIYR